ncbi:AAA family ATPase [Planctellipticum variicoloris]|uniref:AAA family ATPase n=1 Tax=Planctellipticum variicoloris TaxID=3064265 RepID=UPI003013B68D|nr:AAA family ATPase [Planctomycetaceae bacterium SH412]
MNFTDHLFDDSADLVNAEEWLLRADYAAAKTSPISKQLKQRLDAVRATLLQLFPDGEVADIRISDPDERHKNPRVLFATPYGEVELRQLGYGYQSLITWVVDFAARMFEAYPDSPEPLAEPAVCLVDEIDLHLHPTWQRKVMRYLSERFPKTQFIATAHSPLIVQAAAEMQANVAVLQREGDHVVIRNDLGAVKGWRADQILASELFDVPLRSEASEEIVKERTRLLSQAKLSKADKSKLQELEAKMAAFPVGSTSAERAVNDRLQSAVDLLEKVARKPRS